jgi:hypothetical protein
MTMNEQHWGVIESVLEDEIDRHIMSGGLAANRKVIDAALAFVREQRQLAAHPDAGDVDWTQAPEWANWRAVDPNGWAHWFQEEPIKLMTINYSGWVAKTINGIQQGAELWASEVDLPLGVDWRETLRQRRKQEG